ncbi:hypothetical protein F4604DRAFT_1676101 [Suillus subluteus]|nr:hypothetical protein F4604DRAFT_1676101 [Suillus subluteus]
MWNGAAPNSTTTHCRLEIQQQNQCGIISRKIPSTVTVNGMRPADLFVNGPQAPSLDDKDNSYTMDDKCDGEGMVVLEEDGGGTGSQRPVPGYIEKNMVRKERMMKVKKATIMSLMWVGKKRTSKKSN